MILGILHSFPIYLELTLHGQKTLVLYFNVSGTQTSTKSPGNLRASIFGRKKDYGKGKQANGGPRAKRAGPTRPQYQATWDPPVRASWLRCLRSFLHRHRLDLKTPIKKRSPDVLWKERRTNTETPKQRSGAADWRGKTSAGRCRGGLHLLQRLLHRLHDEEGVVHLWTMGLWK